MADQLARRGYQATSTMALGKSGMKDVNWLRFLRNHFGDTPYVLITYDNVMSREHAATLLECQTTLAVIDSRERGPRGAELNESEYVSEVIHRHAHTFFVQPAGSVFRYRCSNRRSSVTLTP